MIYWRNTYFQYMHTWFHVLSDQKILKVSKYFLVMHWRVELNTVAVMHILRHYWLAITPILILINTFFSCFRDNGITVQILKYQLYCEGFTILLLLCVPIENDVLISRINRCLYNFVAVVIQPLFYLNGDVNFRNRVLQQGLLRALDR